LYQQVSSRCAEYIVLNATFNISFDIFVVEKMAVKVNLIT